ncbi:MAG: (d)CMP kinase [Actinobacteria bacterium]|uniref:(d)CMP kinase n=1 Tax=freshwater metagenome TaxID=449393 RepID=A0A6J6FN05_9ZZZZ|nr:(d)CMP kinase [Actinomycetota bacterium]MSY67442.1 (d)CMP kinase [Actinomycetota bacterium]MTA00403.1 (d)CMP kinase [Actinomycetota bacterium]MTB26480.1 (d)CMP kinase [Actinomycetota bacterium]
MPVIAIDGPSGAGKSSVSRGIALRGGWGYLDTGALYRGSTWLALQAGVSAPEEVANLVAKSNLNFNLSASDPKLIANYPLEQESKKDISEIIREELITNAVSAFSAMPEVRRELLLLQRDLIEKSKSQFGGAVVEGRDIGTTVWPDAELKIYLTADVDARATRRQAQLSELSDVSASSVADSLAKRDAIDSMRAASPLRQSEDQIVLDATYLNLEETIQALWNLIEERKING